MNRRRTDRYRRNWWPLLLGGAILLLALAAVAIAVFFGGYGWELAGEEQVTVQKREAGTGQGEGMQAQDADAGQAERIQMQESDTGQSENIQTQEAADGQIEGMQMQETDAGQAEGASAEALSTDGAAQWQLALVNRWNVLPENSSIELAEVPGGEMVDARIYEPLMEMLNDAAEAQLGPIVVSGYRTQEKQQSLYDEQVAEYRAQGLSDEEAVQQAEQWVAIPGTSEHQLGLAVDINGAVYDIYPWLQENSYKYGFIFRYPGSKTELTGVAEEVWHYRYVGKEAAAQIYEQGVCLEEYLDALQG